ncbi:hypothetical protein E4U42_006540 [Claviceps africana]|uniref:Histidine kinase group protein n=1 Tax=Claviceps africana TaxID=83212 RepID=A0A8K0J359_9HYPO|nr:hypothetical protein E4U42_006540 [Claviceps africana]
MAKEEEKRGPEAATVRREEDAKDSAARHPASSAPSTSTSSSSGPSGLGATLTITRNKHWSFISSFHGTWINLPPEILQIVANLNYSTPRPRPLDPAVVFDVLKVRRNVDEATAFAVGAANDVASSTLINVNGGLPQLAPLGHGAKLSKERKLRMRELACQKLARAYRLDEIASSVASMQGASALDNVAGLVLQRKGDNLDAKYCHFFLEKIPSRQLVSSTSLDPLTDILSSGHAQIEALRTRSAVKVFQEDFDGALQDLNEALRLTRFRDLPPSSSSSPSTPPSIPDTLPSRPPKAEGRPRCRNPNTVLSEDEQPTGLVAQLLFQRASVYLNQACRLVASSLPCANNEDEGAEASRAKHGYRKHVKLTAKRALKDYLSFLSRFDYSPNVPTLFMAEFHSDIAIATRQVKSSPMGYSALSQAHTVYSVADLFAALPPSGLPEYPPPPPPAVSVSVSVSDESSEQSGAATTRELVTYHPLLTEALHAILLCHSLMQTSVKELHRHANMVARLVRLCHGEPIFREIRSVSRTDWVEVLRRTDNWIRLNDTWEVLCAPPPPFRLPRKQPQPDARSPAASLARNTESASTQPAPKPDHHGPATPGGIFTHCSKDFPYWTGRATAISLWISHAPVVTGVSKRKKRTGKAVGGGGDDESAPVAEDDGPRQEDE